MKINEISTQELLICKSHNDVARIYKVNENNYVLRINSMSDGEPEYPYKTERGAKIAMVKMLRGRYKDLSNPSTKWE